jgi:hypothetical protein
MPPTLITPSESISNVTGRGSRAQFQSQVADDPAASLAVVTVPRSKPQFQFHTIEPSSSSATAAVPMSAQRTVVLKPLLTRSSKPTIFSILSGGPGCTLDEHTHHTPSRTHRLNSEMFPFGPVSFAVMHPIQPNPSDDERDKA